MRPILLSALLSILATAAHADGAAAKANKGDAGVEAFNAALLDATLKMDNKATMALWEEDGISLLPESPPRIGKATISKFLDEVVASIPNAKMQSFELHCSDIEVSGTMASEWCTEHQVVLIDKDKPPFDGRGNMLLVLHRGADGKWRIKREMWNQGMKP